MLYSRSKLFASKGLMMAMENTCIGFPWFERKDYEKLLTIFVDSHLMPNNYDEWIRFAEEGMDRLIKDGATVETVNIDPVTFAAWCREKGLNTDGKARIAFSDEVVSRKHADQRQ